MTSCGTCTYRGKYGEDEAHLRPWPCTHCEGGENYQERGTRKKPKPLRIQVEELRAENRRLREQLAERDAKVRELEEEISEVRNRNGILAVQREDAAYLAKANPTQAYQRIQKFKDRAESAEAELASIKNKLACALCLNRGTRKNPCPHKNECGYGTGEGVGQKDNNFWVSAVEFDEDCEEVAS